MDHHSKPVSLLPPALCLALALCLLTACGARPQPPAEPDPPDPPEVSATLEELYGADYAEEIGETILMQMGNRMDKTPDVVCFPIRENAPLTDYASIDGDTDFQVNADESVTIFFPAGSVTDEANGLQSFNIPKP